MASDTMDPLSNTSGRLHPRFNSITNNNVSNAYISKLCQQGRLQQALQIFESLDNINSQSYLVACGFLLQCCVKLKALGEGRMVHNQLMKKGLKPNHVVGNNLINMYAKCGCVEDARVIFEEMTTRNVYIWTTMIMGYVQHGNGVEALKLFREMYQERLEPDRVTFISVAIGCACISSLEQGKRVHALILNSSCKIDIILDNTLVDMYAKCGSIRDAHQVFDRMPIKDVISWSALIAGYARTENGKAALELFTRMEWEDIRPNDITFINAVGACTVEASLSYGKHVHAYALKAGYRSTIIENALVDMYAKTRSLISAIKVFESMEVQDIMSWNRMIVGCTQFGYWEAAVRLFAEMQQESIKPNEISYASVISACTSTLAVGQGKRIHAHVLKFECETDLFLGSVLVDLYAKCGSVEYALHLFSRMPKQDVVLWNAMLTAYSQYGDYKCVFLTFREMQLAGMKPTKVTFVSLLSACTGAAALEQGKLVHASVLESKCGSDIIVSNALIDTYTKCRSMRDARQVFDAMSSRDVMSWNSLIGGYVQNGDGNESLELFEIMQQSGIEPNETTIASTLCACANVAALEQGEKICGTFLKAETGLDTFVASVLVDMYAKCGSIKNARKVFDRMHAPDIVVWSTLITGYAQHGDGKEVFNLFKQMQWRGVKGNSVTFVSFLTACGRSFLLDEACHYFSSITYDNGITLSMQHYACLVDILGRAGHLNEGEELIGAVWSEPNTTIWMSFLGVCVIHGDVDRAQRVMEQILRLDPLNIAALVLVSNVYAMAGRWEARTKIREVIQKIYWGKKPRYDFIFMPGNN